MQHIGRDELVKRVAALVGRDPSVNGIVEAVFEQIARELVAGNDVKIRRFGTFYSSKRRVQSLTGGDVGTRLCLRLRPSSNLTSRLGPISPLRRP